MIKLSNKRSSVRWTNKTLFAVALVGLLVLVGGSSALANLLNNHRANVVTGYGYGYMADNMQGERVWGYNTYPDINPIADTVGGCVNGTLVKTATSSTVWWIQDGRKHAVVSAVAFMSWGFNWSDIITVSQATMDLTTLSNTPLKARPGTLMKMYHDQNIYIVGWEGESLEAVHLITSMTVFNNLGLNSADVFEVGIYEFTNYASGADITSSAVLAPGTLIKGSGAAVYLWEGDGLGMAVGNYQIEPFVSPCAFNSWGFAWGDIETINDMELGSYLANNNIPGKNILARPGTLIKGSAPTVYVTDFLARPTRTIGAWTGPWGARDWTIRAIVSGNVFSNKGFKWSNVYTVPDTEVNMYWNDVSIVD